MDPATLLADVGYVLSLANIALATAQDAAPFVKQAYQLIVNGAGLTDAERAELATQETALRAQLDAATIAADQA